MIRAIQQILIKCIIGCCVLLVLTGVHGAAADAILQNTLNAYYTLKSDFIQIVYAKGRILSKSSGEMAFKRPECIQCQAYFYWYNKQPIAQKIVADGHKLWIYDIDLQQISVKKQSMGMSGVPALFLSSYHDSVARNFTVKSLPKSINQCYALRSKSAHASFQHVTLCFKANILMSLEFLDQLGQRTVVKLTNVKINPFLSNHLFKFTPPKGVDIINQVSVHNSRILPYYVASQYKSVQPPPFKKSLESSPEDPELVMLDKVIVMPKIVDQITLV